MQTFEMTAVQRARGISLKATVLVGGFLVTIMRHNKSLFLKARLFREANA